MKPFEGVVQQTAGPASTRVSVSTTMPPRLTYACRSTVTLNQACIPARDQSRLTVPVSAAVVWKSQLLLMPEWPMLTS